MIDILINSRMIFDHFTDTMFTLPNCFFPAHLSALKKEYTFFLLKEGNIPSKAAKAMKKKYGKHIMAKSISLNNTEENKNIKVDLYLYSEEYKLMVLLFCRYKDEFEALRNAKKITLHERAAQLGDKKMVNVNYQELYGVGA